MQIQTSFIQETDSTNHLLRDHMRAGAAEGLVIYTDFQTSGKGQTGNSWESAPGENLLFSLLLRPVELPAVSQFLISMLVSAAVVEYLKQFSSEITIKWPNDIYFQNKKLGGILIENTWQGAVVSTSIVGIGLNINQKDFKSNAPNPVSLLQITGIKHDRQVLLNGLLQQINKLYSSLDENKIVLRYHELLFRKEGYYTYRTDEEEFDARIDRVEKDGRLILVTRDGSVKEFYFKEVVFVI